MKRDLHVEVSHTAENGEESRKTTAPLRPGGDVVILHQNRYNLRTPAANRFL
ncbi:hypothetical protein HanIR_Chr16g0819511 [Helianthus annuus]|nr:hypothetical protein HanIR_Chr16g0819511 [Helianthus annuus]